MAAKDAKDLYKAGEKRLGTDEKTFINIFTQRSWAQMAAIASNYHHAHGRTLQKVSIRFYINLICLHDAFYLRENLQLVHLTSSVFFLLFCFQAVKKETSGHFEFALLTILRCAENPAKFFAKVFF